MILQKVGNSVTPVKAEVSNTLKKTVRSVFLGNDADIEFQTICRFIRVTSKIQSG
jgi:hypothetical protein